MGPHNSLEVLYTDLFISLYHDIAESLRISVVESRRDVDVIRRRIASEGLQFLTVALPKVGKAFDKALVTEHLRRIPGLRCRPGTEIPKLFGEILSRVFTDSGRIRDTACTDCIRALRQLVYFVYKLEMPVNPAKADKVIAEFVKTDQELDTLEIPDDNITDMARMFTTSVFGSFDYVEVKPKHGPGSVATGERPSEKQVFKRIYNDIERVYPFTEYFQYSLLHVCDAYHTYETLEQLEYGTAKVVLVPKDSRGPRIISCEPLEYQWIQQGLGTKIQRHLERHRLTAGHVNFTDQTVNRDLALKSSVTQKWVTLDMKEASDRVSLRLVSRLFDDCPGLLSALTATRSRATKLPDGTVMQLNKFAPMGSNLCFPVESFVFYCLAVSAIMTLTHLPRRKARKMVYVYGDDLIVDREVYPILLQILPRYGLMFNQDKCCTSGFFRESCGCDAYRGVDVTPLRMKKVWNHRRVDAQVMSSYVALSNAAYRKGYHRLASQIEALVESKLGKLPYSDREIGVLSWVGRPVSVYRQPSSVRRRFNKKLHRYEVRGIRSVSLEEKSDPDNWSTVLRRISTPSGQLTKPVLPGIYAIPHRSKPQWGWSPVD